MVITETNVFEIIQDTWTSTLGFQVDYLESQDFSPVGAFTASVKIAGAWDGEVRMHCPPALARLIAGAIFQVEPDKAGNDETLDALGELIHIIGGNLKALLPQPVTVSLPSLVDPTDSAQTTPRGQTVSELTLLSEGHPFMVSISQDLPTGTPAE